tara:strand:+ start:621 stop:1148 length:528 start_codon:yes stop_codon:yes gene_type:complete
MNIQEKLLKIQSELKAPKNQYNSFAKYKYRNQEDILEALKPLLKKYEVTLTISDEVHSVNDLSYINAICRLTDNEHELTTMAQAGIDIDRKGMDLSQQFGSSSSYARKYALNGMFLIDDTKDADSKDIKKATKPTLKLNSEAYKKAKEFLKDGGDINKIKNKYQISLTTQKSLLI